MRIISWNVNGLRARIKTGFEKTIETLDPDIICIQETRATPAQLPKDFLSGYCQHINNHDKAGYAGVGTWIKKTITSKPPAIISGENGRVSLHTFDKFNLANCYTPNAGLKLERLDHRLAWHETFLAHLKKEQENGLPLIYTGDLNCAYQKIDVGSPYIKSGITPQERGAFKKMLDELGLVDVWRVNNPDSSTYTWFSNQFKSKAVNRGMRIDYFLISESLVPRVTKVEIIQDDDLVVGSDHQILLMEVNV